MSRIDEFKKVIYEQYKNDIEELDKETNINIEKYRKGDIKIRVIDKNGNPIKNAKVEIHQKTHDFKYGANLFLLDLEDEPVPSKNCRDTFYKYFNLATIPFYWADLEPEKDKPRYDKDSYKIYRRPAPDLCMEYCNEHGIAPKLHCLFYDKFIPSWLPRRDKEEMLKLYEKRFKEISERYAGKLYSVEVTNELLDEYYWKEEEHSILTEYRDTPYQMYKMAEKYFPSDVLEINEGAQIYEVAKKDFRSLYLLLVDSLLARGARIDKLGMQYHIFWGAKGEQDPSTTQYLDFFNLKMVRKGLKYLCDFNKPIEITEMTIPTFGEGEEAEEFQAELLEEFMKIFFSCPNMDSVVYWNTNDNIAFKPGNGWDENGVHGGLFHKDYTPKKSALKLWELFNKKWHTDTILETDENGMVTINGFYGDYNLDLNGSVLSFGIHKNSNNEINLTI